MSTPAAEVVSRPAPAAPAPLRLPPAPRRVSGPSSGHPRAANARPAPREGHLLWLIDHPWLDRLIRGRTWIIIVAVALLAIVTMQVALLRLGADIGAVTTKVNAQIQSNETALTAIAALQSGAGVRHQAVVQGLVDPSPNQITYLSASGIDARRAAARMHSPTAAALAAELADRQAAARASVPHRSSAASGATSAKTPATGAPASGGAAAAPTGATGATIAPAGATTTPATTTTTPPSTTTATTTTPATTTATPPPTTTAATTTTPPAPSTPPPVSAQGGAVAPAG